MFKLLSIELLKVRRSQALWMMFAIPLVVVVLNLLVMLKRYAIGAISEPQWLRYWMNHTLLWCSFMMPLYIALVTSLLNGHEHRNQTWRLMLTLPISQRQLYLAKAVVAWMFVLGANAVLVGASALSIALLGVAGASLKGAFVFPSMAFLAKISLACLPVLLIQHALSWRVRNLVTPLAVGIAATIGIGSGGSSEYWIWNPWTYSLVAANGSQPALHTQALLLAAGVGAALLVVTAYVLGRRETET